MSTLEVNKIIPQSGTATQLGESGDTITIPAGATITNNGTANGFGSADTEKVKVSSNDTTAGFLNGKLVAGTNITLTEGSDGGDETLTVASTAGGTTLSGSTNNTIPTVTGANALAGEANLTFDGSTLGVTGDMTITKAGDNLKADFSNGVNANFRILTSGTASQIGPSTASDIVFLSSNAEKMRMNSSGILTKPLQPAVQAYVATTQSNIGTGITTVALDAEIYDVNSDFNISNYTFTAPVTGKYLSTMNLVLYDFDNSFQWMYLLGVSSNRNYYLNQIDPRMLSQDGIWSFAASTLVDMDANDTFQMKVRTSSHGAAQMDIASGTANATETTMTMTLLS